MDMFEMISRLTDAKVPEEYQKFRADEDEYCTGYCNGFLSVKNRSGWMYAIGDNEEGLPLEDINDIHIQGYLDGVRDTICLKKAGIPLDLT